jgi:hypothetical protein
MIVKDSHFTPKNPKKYHCIICDFYSSNKKDFERHKATDKHKKRGNGSEMVVNDSDFTPKNPKLYNCECGKIYKYDSGYYRHKKMCKNNIDLIFVSITL